MKFKKTVCSTVLILLPVFWMLPAFAQNPFFGVWFGIDPNDGSEGYIAVDSKQDFIFFDTDATGGCAQTGGGPFLASSKTGGVIVGDTLKGLVTGLCQGDKSKLEFGMFITYLPEIDEITTRGGFFYRVGNVDADAFVRGVLEMKTVAKEGWAFLDLVFKGSPVVAPPPGVRGADCTDPPNLVPGADLRDCDLAGADLASIDLSGADLTDALLTLANLAGANLNGSILRGAILKEAILQKADLIGADLSCSPLKCTDLRSADLRLADLTDADLSGADLRFVTWGDLLNVNIGADLTRTDLFGAQMNLLPDGTLFFVTWSDTTCPDGTNSDIADGDGFTCLNNLALPPPPL